MEIEGVNEYDPYRGSSLENEKFDMFDRREREREKDSKNGGKNANEYDPYHLWKIKNSRERERESVDTVEIEARVLFYRRVGRESGITGRFRPVTLGHTA